MVVEDTLSSAEHIRSNIVAAADPKNTEGLPAYGTIISQGVHFLLLAEAASITLKQAFPCPEPLKDDFINT